MTLSPSSHQLPELACDDTNTDSVLDYDVALMLQDFEFY